MQTPGTMPLPFGGKGQFCGLLTAMLSPKIKQALGNYQRLLQRT
jgi:hypothetical protein